MEETRHPLEGVVVGRQGDGRTVVRTPQGDVAVNADPALVKVGDRGQVRYFDSGPAFTND